MATIVGAFAMSHQLGAPASVEEQSERVFQGMREIGRRIRALAPDVLVILGSDHLNNFTLTRPMPLAVGTAPSFMPFGDMGLPMEPIPGAPVFAGKLLEEAAAAGIEIAEAADLKPDHGMMIPLGIVDPDRRIPAVPVYINTVFYPEPTPGDCADFGKWLGQFVRSLPGNDRVVLLGAGGLSHWVGMPQEGNINEAWDETLVAEFAAGDIAALATRQNADTLAAAGNGGLEINAWIAVAAAVPQSRGSLVFYEAMPEWATGMAGMEFTFD